MLKGRPSIEQAAAIGVAIDRDDRTPEAGGAVRSDARSDASRLISQRRSGRICERHRLLMLLEDALQSRVTMIVAPAGYGKTTLLAQWCARLTERSIAIGYCSASARNREPAAFLTMVAAALARVGIEIEGRPVTEQDRVRGDIALDDILLALELAGQPLVLIIDDFERINEPGVTELVKRLIDEAPAALHLILSTRTFPAIPLSALEAAGDLHRIDAYQLRLDRDELAWMLELEPGAPELGEIEMRTEGWPVTAELYRLWRNRQGGTVATGTFGGHVAEVQNYMAEQLFSSLPAEQYALLVDIADADEVAADLVDAMRNRADSAGLLQTIAEAIPSLMWSNRRHDAIVYRLHPLLLDHLRQDLARDPHRRSGLASNAADWFVRRSRFPEAVRAALDARDDEVLLKVVRGMRPIHIMIAEGAATLRTILHEIPDAVVASHPRLQIMAAIAHFKAGLFVESRAMLEQVKRATGGFAVDPDGSPERLEIEGRLTELVFMVQTARYSDRVDTLCEQVRAAASDDPIIWAACDNVMMLVHQVRGQFDEAEEAIARTRRIYEARQLSRYGLTQVICHEVLTQIGRGRLHLAADLVASYQKQPGIELPHEAGTPTQLKLLLAFVRYQQDYGETSIEALRKSFTEHSRTESWLDQHAISYPCIVARLMLRDGSAAALDFIADAKARAQRRGFEALPDFLTFLEIEHRARAGDVAGAELLSNEIGLEACALAADPKTRLRGWRERDAALVAFVRLRIAQQQPAAARLAAVAAAREADAGGRLLSAIKALLLAALAASAAGQDAPARADLLRAVMQAYPEKIVAPFAEEGEALLPLIARLEADAGIDGFARRHLKAVREAIGAATARPDTRQLNARELEVVRHLAEGLSNKVIARRLGISDHTVKFHLKKVFAKLEVSSRRAAVARVAGLAD
jgi:LuxR family maltose regulon positive regulatory protein